MARMEVKVRTDNEEFDHGHIEIVHKDGIEKTIQIQVRLVISEDVGDFHEELEELIKKYAI